MSRTLTVADLLKELKTESSKWLKTKDDAFFNFHWQEGYGVFSVSPSHVESVRSYIANQEQHHKKSTFQDEFRRILLKYNVMEFDPSGTRLGLRLTAQNSTPPSAPPSMFADRASTTPAWRGHKPVPAP